MSRGDSDSAVREVQHPAGLQTLYDSQDRLREKTNAREHGLTTPRFAAVDDERSLRDAVDGIGLPAVLKTRTLGYDGHGQLVLRTEADLERALPLLSVPCILEEFVPFDFEASIVMVADRERVVSFPVGRNVHRDGILDLSIVPAGDGAEVVERMRCESERFMRECGYEGILAIEYFVRGGEIYFNEMAPRPTIRDTTRSRGPRRASSASWCATSRGCRSKSRGWWLPR